MMIPNGPGEGGSGLWGFWELGAKHEDSEMLNFYSNNSLEKKLAKRTSVDCIGKNCTSA